jgi:hypothetical protein
MRSAGLGAAICALGVLVALTPSGQAASSRVERVKRRIAREIAAQAALRGAKAELPKDNSSCLLCHANLENEQLVKAHLAVGVTCALCHGLSYEHKNDETSRTKPDVTYGRAEVARFCQRCHGKHRNRQAVARFLEQWRGKTRPNGRLILQQAMCTDCHGIHVMVAVPVRSG